jgi:hypothetical protein
MESLKVIVPEHEGEDIDVLLNQEKNGKVGEVLIVSEGFVFISVDLQGAEEKFEDVTGTTPDKPHVCEIKVTT